MPLPSRSEVSSGILRLTGGARMRRLAYVKRADPKLLILAGVGLVLTILSFPQISHRATRIEVASVCEPDANAS